MNNPTTFDEAADYAVARAAEVAAATDGTTEEAAEAFTNYILAFSNELTEVVTSKLYGSEAA